MRSRSRAALFALLFLSIASLFDGVAHPLLSVVARGYFPGLVTSPVVAALGGVLLRSLLRVTRPLEHPTGAAPREVRSSSRRSQARAKDRSLRTQGFETPSATAPRPRSRPAHLDDPLALRIEGGELRQGFVGGRHVLDPIVAERHRVVPAGLSCVEESLFDHPAPTDEPARPPP